VITTAASRVEAERLAKLCTRHRWQWIEQTQGLKARGLKARGLKARGLKARGLKPGGLNATI
jgi:ribosomal protein L15E